MYITAGGRGLVSGYVKEVGGHVQAVPGQGPGRQASGAH